ncbi:MAG: T9SS type A sorting domain-containing protein [Sphingobacteriaceae bacterium]|nr:T9SS type A sorting domain-containing protein [Sphingobacteriaceae bacterium]
MKKIYLLFTAIVIGSGANAQLTITKTANQPVAGDIVLRSDYDSTTAVAKATGTGMNWNFTNLTIGSFTETNTYTTVASTPAGSLFPTANVAVIRGNNDYEYYNNQTGSIAYAGMANTSNTSITTFANQATKLNWPTAFGNSNSDVFSGTEVTPTSTVNWNGTLSYTATGSGTVTMPDGSKHNNCLQVKTIITLTMTGSNTMTMTMINYEYYSSVRRYPIISIEYQTMKQGTVTNTGYDIKVDAAALTSVSKNVILNSDVVVYPNPAKDIVNVELPANTIAEKMEIMDVTGRIVLSTDNSNSLNTSSITKGIYLLKVSSGNSTIQKQVIITE